MTTTTTRDKVEIRILAALAVETSSPARAISSAAWDALQEAKALGWSEDAQVGLVQTFIETGREILARALAEVGR